MPVCIRKTSGSPRIRSLTLNYSTFPMILRDIEESGLALRSLYQCIAESMAAVAGGGVLIVPPYVGLGEILASRSKIDWWSLASQVKNQADIGRDRIEFLEGLQSLTWLVSFFLRRKAAAYAGSIN